MKKVIEIDGKKMTIRASALIPKLYRYHFGRDIIVDMQTLKEAYDKSQEGKDLTALDLTIFENITWLFLKQGGEDVGDSADEWLDSLDGIFSVYQVLPEILDLWQKNLKTTAKPKKK